MFEPSPRNVGEDVLRIHRAITRGLMMSILFLQDPENQSGFHHGFTLYLRALSALLHAHHLGEDEIGFPFWRKKIPFAPFPNLIRDHMRMTPLLERIEIWLNTGESMQGAKSIAGIHSVLTELNTIWLLHIQMEENVIGPAQAAARLTPEENLQLSNQLAAHGQEHAQPGALVIPFILYNLQPEDRMAMEDVFPSIVIQQLVAVEWKPVWEPMKPFLLE